MLCSKCSTPSDMDGQTFTIGKTYNCPNCKLDFQPTGFTCQRELPADNRLKRWMDAVESGEIEVEHIVAVPHNSSLW